MVGRNDAAGPRHVLHDKLRTAGDVFPEMTAHQPRGNIRGAARRRRNDEDDGFPLIKGPLPLGLCPQSVSWQQR